ncbi:uncharacterized protein [Euwallacea fornicatus]|uniref:uncharacterized protein isoform X2 n=1 Tax=Euwallacea fornicatus TaxID=995702 RepID=UPI0033901C0C
MIMIYRLTRIVFGTLYPAYASYKAVKTKNVKEYVKWMMYWIVFALFTCAETFTDIFLSWFPFYYEIKVILVIWLLSPATKGSSILYRKFVHPMLSSREQEIDEYISKAKEQSYKQVLGLGQKGVTVLMQTAIKSGGGIVSQLKKSYSLSDLSDPSNSASDEVDDVLVTDPRLIRRRKSGRSPHRSSSASSASVYFSEVDVVNKRVASGEGVAELRSIEDISSGYSSGEGLYVAHQPLKLQSRDSIANQRTNSLTRSRSTRVTRSSVPKKSSITSDDSDENEVFDTNIVFFNDRARKILPETNNSSSSETEFHDIPDTIGFELHGKSFVASPSNSNIDHSTTTVVNINNNPTESESADRQGHDSKLTACTNDFSNSTLRSNLTKLSSVLSSLSSSFATKMNSEEVISSQVIPSRGGKYYKKLAPLPPLPPKKENSEGNPIKATLVLQPGVVRSLSSSAESLNKEIFINYSPKMRRRSRNRSPASGSDSSAKNQNAFSKMLRFPKKFNVPGKVKEKRSSWGDFFSTNKKLVESKVQSKSDCSLDVHAEDGGKEVVKSMHRSGSQVSIKSLTDSPLAHRRTTQVPRCLALKSQRRRKPYESIV